MTPPLPPLPPMSPPPGDGTSPRFSDVRAVVVFVIMGIFAVTFILMMFITPPQANHDSVSQFEGALILAFGAAYGYYLSNSSGAAQARDQVGKALDVAKAAAPDSTTTITRMT